MRELDRWAPASPVSGRRPGNKLGELRVEVGPVRRSLQSLARGRAKMSWGRPVLIQTLASHRVKSAELRP